MAVQVNGNAREEAVGSPSIEGGNHGRHVAGPNQPPAGSGGAAVGNADTAHATSHRWGSSGREPAVRRLRTASFTVYTARGRGSYRSRAKAESAARWVAEKTGERVTVVNEGTGEIKEISAWPPRGVAVEPASP